LSADEIKDDEELFMLYTDLALIIIKSYQNEFGDFPIVEEETVASFIEAEFGKFHDVDLDEDIDIDELNKNVKKLGELLGSDADKSEIDKLLQDPNLSKLSKFAIESVLEFPQPNIYEIIHVEIDNIETKGKDGMLDLIFSSLKTIVDCLENASGNDLKLISNN